MLISHRHNFITIDIPKTGTRTLRVLLHEQLKTVDKVGQPADQYNQHITACELKKLLPVDWTEYYVFTLVRNPWDRFFSYFNYYNTYREKYIRQCPSIHWGEDQINQGKMCVKLFENRSNLDVFKKIISQQRAQHEYYLDENNQYLISHAGMFENFSDEIHRLVSNLSLSTPTKVPHKNKSFSDTALMKELFTNETIELIYEKEKHTIITKSYEFDYK